MKENFKITIENYGKSYSIELPYSDVNMEELYELIQQLLVCAGYHPDTVKEFFENE